MLLGVFKPFQMKESSIFLTIFSALKLNKTKLVTLFMAVSVDLSAFATRHFLSYSRTSSSAKCTVRVSVLMISIFLEVVSVVKTKMRIDQLN